jgi:hypothetical protein
LAHADYSDLKVVMSSLVCLLLCVLVLTFVNLPVCEAFHGARLMGRARVNTKLNSMWLADGLDADTLGALGDIQDLNEVNNQPLILPFYTHFSLSKAELKINYRRLTSPISSPRVSCPSLSSLEHRLLTKQSKAAILP